MIMYEETYIKRDAERDVWQETLDAVRDIKAGHTETVEIPECAAQE